MNTVSEGDFKSLPLDEWEREMLEDAYKAVTKANRWDFLRRPDVPGPNGFMFSNWPQVKDIDSFMEYGGHSGGSYGCTMRAMEFIAKNGWDEYARDVQEQDKKRKEEEAKQKALNNLFKTASVVDEAMWSSSMKNPVAFAESLRANPQVRAVIPDIDEQAAAMKKFSEGRMSYAEMRSICG